MKTIKLNNSRHFAKVDDEDYKLVSKYQWRVLKHNLSDRLFYAVTNVTIGATLIGGREYGGRVKRLSLHRLIMNAGNSDIVDHINGDGLDNRKSNLRFCIAKQNSANASISKANKSGFKGVYFRKSRKKYVAVIGDSRKKGYYLGCFKRKKDAINAYRNEAERRYATFAYQNRGKV